MKKIFFLIIGLMLVAAPGCGGSKSKYSADSPEGAVEAYYNALKDGKPEVAYEYRKFDPPKTKDAFVKERKASPMPFKDFFVGKATVNGDRATVPVKFKTGNSTMPELTINVIAEKEGSTWKYKSSGSGSNPHGASPSTGGMPPAGSSMPPPGSGTAPQSAK